MVRLQYNNERKRGYKEFTKIENNKERANIQATNILSQGLPRHVFNILNQTRIGKEIWDNVELLMKGSGKSLQQQKEELFDEYRHRFRAIGYESMSSLQHCDPVAYLVKQQYHAPTQPLLHHHHHNMTTTFLPPHNKYPYNQGNEAMLATYDPNHKLVEWFPKQFPPNQTTAQDIVQLRSHDTGHNGSIIIEKPFREELPG
ncbi:hypothetical protein Tco_1253148 [Tanacetum coccineum]